MTKQQLTCTLYDRLVELIRMDKKGTDIAGNELTHDTRIVIWAKISELVNTLDLLGLKVEVEDFYSPSK